MQASAQLPVTNLYVFQLVSDDTSGWHIYAPTYISVWNEGNYTNQPEWIDRHTLLVSAQRTGDTQNDIYRIDLEDNVLRRMTVTPDSEFSPSVTPDRKHFSVLRQKQTEEKDQQVVQFSFEKRFSGEELLPSIKDVGYYCWLGATRLALVTDTEPPKLALASQGTENFSIYSSGIGRCIRKLNNGDLCYVHKYSETFWFLKSLDLSTRKSQIITETLTGKEDFAIGPTGQIFMASGSTLYVFDPGKPEARWTPIYDLSVFGLHKITRLAISEDNRIAIVDMVE